MYFIYLLIGIMTFILVNHYYTKGKNRAITIEGLTNKESKTEYQGYNEENDPLILAKKNAANISYMKEKVDEMSELNKLVQDISKKADLNEEKVNQLVKVSEQKAQAISDSMEEEGL